MAETKLDILVTVRDAASQALAALSNAVGDLGGNLAFAGDKAGIIASGLAVLGGKITLDNVKAFNDQQVAMSEAFEMFTQFPGGLKDYESAITFANDAQQKFGFDADDLVRGLAQLYTATGGNMPNALQAMQAAMGYAVAKLGGPDGLNSAVSAMLPVFAGGGRAVKALGFAIDEHASAQTAFQTIINSTEATMRGWAGTNARVSETLKQNITDTQELAGGPMANLIGQFQGLLNPMLNFINHSETAQIAIESVGTALGALSLIMAVKALPAIIEMAAGFLGLEVVAGTTGFAVLAAAGSFALAALAIGAIVFSIVYLIQNFDTVKWAFGIAADWIKTKAKDMAEGIKNAWGSMINWLADNVWTPLFKKIDDLIGKFKEVWGWIEKVGQKTGNAVSGFGANVVGGFKIVTGQIDDGIVQNGRVITTNPSDYIVATKNPSSLGGGNGITVNLNGDLYTDTETAEKFANRIAFIIKNQLNLGGINA